MNEDYVDLKYSPADDELVAMYKVVPADGMTIERACGHIAAESSIGTWTTIATMSDRIKDKLQPHVYSINKKTGVVKIAYSSDLFEAGNLPQILSSIAGNIFGMSAVKALRLIDIRFPKKIVSKSLGPKYGIAGVRKVTGVKKRPLVGTIVKPKVGLNEAGHAKVAYDAWRGGLDLVKDDENLTSLPFNKFEKRIELTLALRDKAASETGERKFYMPNVTAESREMIRRAEFVRDHGGEYVMIDILTAGFSALQTLREADLGLVIHAHRAMHGALTRNPDHGISMLTLGKVSRLIGVDQLHVGAIVGKMHGSGAEVVTIQQGITQKDVLEDDSVPVLAQSWGSTKPVFPVASGGLHPGLSGDLVKYMGTDVIMQYGGGCHGHPDGTQAGARAIRQSVELFVDKKGKLADYPELEAAVKKWMK